MGANDRKVKPALRRVADMARFSPNMSLSPDAAGSEKNFTANIVRFFGAILAHTHTY